MRFSALEDVPNVGGGSSFSGARTDAATLRADLPNRWKYLMSDKYADIRDYLWTQHDVLDLNESLFGRRTPEGFTKTVRPAAHRAVEGIPGLTTTRVGAEECRLLATPRYYGSTLHPKLNRSGVFTGVINILHAVGGFVDASPWEGGITSSNARMGVRHGTTVKPYEGVSRPDNAKQISGTAICLVTPGASNFSHWLFDLVPKIKILRDQGVDCASATIITNGLRNPNQVQCLSKFGISRERTLWANRRDRWFYADEIYAVTGARQELSTPGWLVEFTRATFCEDYDRLTKAGGGKRVYLSRRKASRRHVINEDAVVKALSSLGFEVVFAEELAIEQMATLMAQTRFLVAPHGGGVANIVFCPPRAHVLELFSWHISPEYWMLSNACQLHHHVMECRGPGGRIYTEMTDEEKSYFVCTNSADIEVDVAELVRLVRAAL
jgi:hypothetical protein